MINLIKTSLNVCGPCKYRINAINKKHLNIPRCRINPNKEAIWLYAELFLGHHDGSCHGLW